MIVEVCANSLASAITAEKAGADRIELCTALGVGGLTPSYGLLKAIKDQVSIPVHVLIRPRVGDFTYSDAEFACMLEDIALCKQMGFEGIVSGILHKDLTVDVLRTTALVEAAKGMNFTFHRAFDWTPEPEEALKDIEKCGANILLSSGQETKAEKGISLLERLQFSSKNITVMPGSGIGVENAEKFKEVGFKAIHLSGVVPEKSMDNIPDIPMSSMAYLRDDYIYETSYKIIEKVCDTLRKN